MNDLSTCDILNNDNKEIHDLKIELTISVFMYIT